VWKKLKKIIRQAYNEGLHNSHAWQDITLPKEKRPGKVYLSEKEVEQLRSVDLSHKPGLERSRDVWIIAYDLFMRYCDVIRIERSMVFSDKDGTQYLRYISQKTSTVASIPLRKKTIELIEKYDWRLDIVTNQQLNRDIKRIASMANISQVVSQDREKAPKCEFITAHTARRSAATNAQLSGVDLRTIQHVGGWKDIKTVEVYLRASNVTVAVNAAKHSFFRD
jgi:site-specific recombinase XerD